jgi:hypothetical protein
VASKKIEVQILGDATSLSRAFGQAEKSTSRLGSAMGKVGAVAKIAGLAIVGGIGVGLERSIKAAMEAETAQKRLDQSFKNVGLSSTKYAAQLQKTEDAARKLGFTEIDTEGALGSLITATGNVGKATADLAVAQDVARFKGIGLVDATKMMTMAMTGSQRAAKQLGITVSPVSTTYDTLKASMGKTIDATEKLRLAHAKLIDKQLTGQAVIDAVNAKVQGQGAAFAATAAGGMAQFHAQLSHLEEVIGAALLPSLGKVITALSSLIDWLSSSPEAAKVASTALMVLKDVMSVVVAAGERLLGFYQQHRTAALAVAGVLTALALAFAGPITVIAALGVGLIELYKRSETFRNVANAAFQSVHDKVLAVMPTIRAIIAGVVTAVEAIWRQFGSTIISVTTTALNTVVRVFRDLGGVISGVVALIGDIIHGRWGKIWGDLAKIVTNALNIVTTILSGFVSIVYQAALSIGKALIGGILAGITGLGESLFNSLKGHISGAISRVKGIFHIGSPSQTTADEIGKPLAEGVVLGWILGSAALPSKMSQTMQNAIEAARTAITNARSVFETAFSGLSSIADRAFDAVASTVKTKSEKALAALVSAHDMAQAAANLAQAQAGLATAQATGDPATILAAQQQVDDLLYQAQVAALEKRAAAERLNLDAAQAVRKQHFDNALAALQDHLAKHGATAAQATQSILKLLRSYGVNFKAVGQDMGVAWIEGLKEALQEAAKSSGKLSGTIGAAAAAITIPQRATAMASGGIVTRPTLALLGEDGPEAVVPLGHGGAGGITVNVSAGMVVGSGGMEELATKIQEQLIRKQRVNGSLGFAT